MDWEESTDKRLDSIIERLDDVDARLMAVDNSNGRIVELFEKLWEGFSQFKDSPMLRMLAGGISKNKSSSIQQGP